MLPNTTETEPAATTTQPRRVVIVVAILAGLALASWLPRPSDTFRLEEGPITPVASQLVVADGFRVDDAAALDRWAFLTIRATQMTNAQNALSWLFDTPAERLPVPSAAEVDATSEMETSASTAMAVASDVLADGIINGHGQRLHLVPVIDGVGGASAGLIYTLASVDAGLDCDLTGGRAVTGTGTIDGEGHVGPIAGVRLKASAAQAAGYEVLLLPVEHMAAVESMGTGMELVAVAHVVDALDYLLPKCA